MDGDGRVNPRVKDDEASSKKFQLYTENLPPEYQHMFLYMLKIAVTPKAELRQEHYGKMQREVQRTFTKLEGKLAEVEDRKAIDVGSVN